MNTLSPIQILFLCSYIAFGLAAAAAVTALIVFFKCRIPAVIGDLTGKTARKSIERMRSEKENNRSRVYPPNRIPAAEYSQDVDSEDDLPQTGVLVEDMTGLQPGTETTLLGLSAVDGQQQAETTLLGQPAGYGQQQAETTPLGQPAGYGQQQAETTPLEQPAEDGPPPLGETAELIQYVSRRLPGGNTVRLEMLDEVTLVHTDESL